MSAEGDETVRALAFPSYAKGSRREEFFPDRQGEAAY